MFTGSANKVDSEQKVVAMTADGASDMDVAAKKQHILKHGWLTNIFHPAAQKIYTITSVSRWAPKISVGNSVSHQV